MYDIIHSMIIGITGLIGSGKDTVADYLCDNHNFRRMSWAGTLKDAVSSIFGWDREMLEGLTLEAREEREKVDTWWANRLDIPHLTPRWVLQNVGTDVFREHFHTDIWVASVENQLRNTSDNIVISDCRFKNEVDAIKNSGGITFRVHRGKDPEWVKYAYDLEKNKSLLEEYGIHPSEYMSVGLDYDYHIYNDDTLESLYDTVYSIIHNKVTSLPSDFFESDIFNTVQADTSKIS